MSALKFFTSLEEVATPAITTRAAAFYLSLEPQTLHRWACYDCGPIRPFRIGRSLRWRTSDVRELLAQKGL